MAGSVEYCTREGELKGSGGPVWSTLPEMGMGKSLCREKVSSTFAELEREAR